MGKKIIPYRHVFNQLLMITYYLLNDTKKYIFEVTYLHSMFLLFIYLFLLISVLEEILRPVNHCWY